MATDTAKQKKSKPTIVADADKLKELGVSARREIRKAGNRIEALESIFSVIAGFVVAARMAVTLDGVPDLAGSSRQYKDWYNANVDAIIGEHVGSDFTATVRGRLRYHVQTQLRTQLRKAEGRDKADKLLKSAGLDPLTQVERQAQKNAKQPDTPRAKQPSDETPASDAIYSESAAKESDAVRLAEVVARATLDLSARLAASDKLAKGDRDAILSHLNRATENIGTAMAALGEEIPAVAAA